MNLTLKEYLRLPKEERQLIVQKYAMLFAMRHHQKENPGCSEHEAFQFAGIHWRNFREKAVDLVCIEIALAEQQLEAN